MHFLFSLKQYQGLSIALMILTGLLLPVAWMPPLSAGLVIILALFLVVYRYVLGLSTKWTSAILPLLWLILIVMGLIIGLYRQEGFIYPLVFQTDALHPGGLPFSLHINTSKTLAGYLVFLALLTKLNSQPQRPRYFGLACLFGLCASVVGLASVALPLEFHLKSAEFIVPFALVNLASTCVAEEAFMRLLLQQELSRGLRRLSRNLYVRETLPLFVSTMVFSLTHATSSLEFTVVYTFAGFSYGLIFTLTKNLGYAIALHFLVNLLHFCLLSYPLLQ